MSTRKISKDTEKLDAINIEKVIALLEPKEGKPITKKDACAILCISYNTTRLGTIIEKYKENKLKDAARRAEKRGTPATTSEIEYVITAYLEGEAVSVIAASLYRGDTFVKTILEKYGVPIRQSAHSYYRPELVPEEAMRETFRVGEKIYSMRYDSLAVIRSEFKPGVYNIYLLSEKYKEFAYQPSEELASLDHLRKLGINI